MQTFGALKTKLRRNIWPQGEAISLVVPHDKSFVDALIDLQTWVECLQHDNTQIVPQCATYYNCGLTILPAPRGIIRSVSVIDKINPETHEEDPDSPDDWCSEIIYTQVDHCHIQSYLNKSQGCCVSIPLFFGLLCNKYPFPTPTDEGVPTNLPVLNLGYHYPQTSTDSTLRAESGVWAMERGKIFIAPWIQSTETVVVKVDGIKRTWVDLDLVDDDPLFEKAVEEYVRWEHARKFDRDDADAATAYAAFFEARQMLIHQCREETRVRDCEPSHARSSPSSTSTLYYNDEQSFTATCPSNETGEPVTVKITAGTVASLVSVADANQRAFNEAKSQAESRLDCEPQTVTYPNDPQSFTATCEVTEGSPLPDGASVTVTITAGTVQSTISVADANATALAMAQDQAEDQLDCVWWNGEQSYTSVCFSGTGPDVTRTVAPHTHSSPYALEDAQVRSFYAAKKLADAALVCNAASPVVYNTEQVVVKNKVCSASCTVKVTVTLTAGYFSSVQSQSDANQQALNYGNFLANIVADIRCDRELCGEFEITYP